MNEAKKILNDEIQRLGFNVLLVAFVTVLVLAKLSAYWPPPCEAQVPGENCSPP